MRRFASAIPAVLATVVAVLTLSTGTALADGGGHGGGHKAAQASHQKADHHKRKAKHPKKIKSIVTMTGVISDTPTATIGSTSDTATSTITIAVKGGERTLHGATVTVTIDTYTVVRRAGTPDATAADLQKGDHVSVRARRMPDGSWLALRVNASPPEPDGTKDD